MEQSCNITDIGNSYKNIATAVLRCLKTQWACRDAKRPFVFSFYSKYYEKETIFE